MGEPRERKKEFETKAVVINLRSRGQRNVPGEVLLFLQIVRGLRAGFVIEMFQNESVVIVLPIELSFYQLFWFCCMPRAAVTTSHTKILESRPSFNSQPPSRAAATRASRYFKR
jgi:hypothetical protein